VGGSDSNEGTNPVESAAAECCSSSLTAGA
jgi:hypothetical protein